MKKILIAALLLMSCDDLFDTHPYDINFEGETGINVKQIAKIESLFAEKDTLRVAFISDTHVWYSDTKDEVANLNQRTDIDFVIHCCDMLSTLRASASKPSLVEKLKSRNTCRASCALR